MVELADNMSPEQRKKNMKAIKAVSKLEGIVSRELWRRGYRFRRNQKSLYGKPDISIKKDKVAIFIDSCFWHQCEVHGNIPKTNTKFWKDKLKKNQLRDENVNNYYEKAGWFWMRIWEHEIKEDLEAVIEKLICLIERAKTNKSK